MKRPSVIVLLSALCCTPAFGNGKDKASSEKHLTQAQRLEFIKRAQVWSPTDVPAMNIKAGLEGSDAFPPNEMVTCDFVTAKLSGNSRKFDCALADGDVVKVRYGADNGEVYGSVLATRLLWALGFGADRVYPVRVTCRGCSDDPWKKHEKVNGEHVFDPAVIERKPAGKEMNADTPGWAWPELDRVDESVGGAPKAQRDAANYLNRAPTGSVNFDEWSATPIWRDASKCEGHLSKSNTGTLDDPWISEAGRKFLSDLLLQLTDRQLHDLFEVARVDRRSRKPGPAEPPATVDAWVAAFKQKRDQIAASHCKS